MASAPDTDLPRKWGRYTLTEVLGRGGMGIVYGATLRGRGGFEKSVALKVLRPGKHDEDLLNEARLGGLLHHPFIVETYDVGVHEGQVFVAMEWVRGPTLADIHRAHGAPFPPATAVDIAKQLCLGLSHAHALEIRSVSADLVHLDIKPANLLLDPVGLVKITDFGIARARGIVDRYVEGEAYAGTRGYMAPELLIGEAFDVRADVFAVGTVLAEMALGRRLWPRSGGWIGYAKAVTSAHEWLTSEGISEELDAAVPGLGNIVVQTLRSRPTDRTPSMLDLHEQLTQVDPGGGSIASLVVASVGVAPSVAPIAHLSGTTASRAQTTNLLRTEPPLFGRDSEQQALESALQTPGVLTLLGPSGMGKTHLSRSVGHDVLRHFPGGVWFVDLAAAVTLDDVLGQIRQVWQVSFENPDPDERVAEMGRRIASLGRVLVILDNFEQVVDCAAPALATWAGQAVDATFLVTSQRRLGIAGERVVRVAPLSIEGGVALFQTRASQAGGSAEDRTCVERIVERLDGLPLAIELAASRSRVLSLEQIELALNDQFRVLVDRSGSRPARHQALRSAVAWSWNLLDPWMRAALAQLSVFRASFTLDRARQVMDLSAFEDAPWTLFVIEELLDRSLLVLKPGPEPHFRMLLGVREFSSEQLSGDERLAAEKRHGDVFAQFGTWEAIQARYGPDSHANLAALLAVDADVSHAMELGIARADAKVAFGATRAWLDIQTLSGAFPAIEEGLRRALRVELEPQGRLSLLLNLGEAHRRLGRWEQTEKAAYRGLTLARAVGNDRYAANFGAQIAQIAQQSGRREEALELYREAREKSRRAGDPMNTLILGTNYALGLRGLGRLAEAEAENLGVIEACERRGYEPMLADAAQNLGYLYLLTGDHENSQIYLNKAQAIHERIGNHMFVSQGLYIQGMLHHARGAHRATRTCFRKSIQIARRMLGPSEKAAILTGIAFTICETDPSKGQQLATEAMEALAETTAEADTALVSLARCHLRLGDSFAALEASERAVGPIAKSTLWWRLRATAVRGLARFETGDRAGAEVDRHELFEILDRVSFDSDSWLMGDGARLAKALALDSGE